MKAFNQINTAVKKFPLPPLPERSMADFSKNPFSRLVQRQKTLFLTHGMKKKERRKERGGKRRKAHRPPYLEPHVRVKKRD